MNFLERFDMRAVVVLVIFGLFAWAYGENPGDQTFTGALIAAFSGAWGYYLGSSNSSKEIRQQVTAAQQQGAQAMGLARSVVENSDGDQGGAPKPVRIVQPPSQPIPTTEIHGGAPAPADPQAPPAGGPATPVMDE